MFSEILVLFLLFVVATSPFPYPPFSSFNHHSQVENLLDPSGFQDRRTLQKNEVVGCEEFLNVIGLEELQDLVEAFAERKGVNPFLVLRKLNRRMRNKEEREEALMNVIDGPPIPELLHQPIFSIQSERNPYSLSPDVTRTDGNPPIHQAGFGYADPGASPSDDNVDDTKVVIIPVVTSSWNSTQLVVKPEQKLRNEISFSAHNLVGKLNNMLPGMFEKNNQLKPPLGATVRVNSGDSLSSLNRDIVVTVSPLMTLTEALRQAEIKFQNIFELSHDIDFITFAHSATVNCFIVNSIENVFKNENFGWKITIMERDGKVAYDSFCLPNGKDALVKSGTLISLAYVPL